MAHCQDEGHGWILWSTCFFRDPIWFNANGAVENTAMWQPRKRFSWAMHFTLQLVSDFPWLAGWRPFSSV